MELDSEEDEFLNLSLSVSSAERKKKGKIIREYAVNSSTHEEKIFRLLHLRDQMLRQNHDKRIKGDAGNINSLSLIHSLLTTATAVDENNFASALENLTALYQTVSLKGDSVQRVAAYFADGLTARLLTKESPFYDTLMEEPTNEEELFLGFTDLYRASPFYQFAHFTANQAILEVFESEEDRNSRALHVIDFDVSYGFQWPSLIQSLSEKATSSHSRISLRITGFGNSVKELQETESRLVSFSNGFVNLLFEFQGLVRGSRSINVSKRKNETVAVNLVSYLNISNLRFVRSLNPSIVVLLKQEGNSGNLSIRTNFLSTFTESLHYFAAMFDSLDDCLPLESTERLRIERKLLGKEIKSMLNYDVGVEDCSAKYERMETWKARMESHGFVGTKISSKSVIQAKLLLKMRTHYYCPIQLEQEEGGGGGGGCGFRVYERDEGRAISLGWQNRFLLTVSAWQPAV